jgi:hypothetical protein
VVAVRAEEEAFASVVFPVTSSVPPTPTLPLVVSVDAVVVAKVEVPDTARVPCDDKELVKIPSVARRSAVKKEAVEVALVKDAESAERRLLTVRDVA